MKKSILRTVAILGTLSPLVTSAATAPKYFISCQATLTPTEGRAIRLSSHSESSEAPTTQIDFDNYTISAKFVRTQLPYMMAYSTSLNVELIKKDQPDAPLATFSADSTTQLSSVAKLNFAYQGSNITDVKYSCRLEKSGPTAQERADAINSDPCRKTVEEAIVAFTKNDIKGLVNFGYDPDACKIAEPTKIGDVLLPVTSKFPSQEVQGATHYSTLVNCQPNFPLPNGGLGYDALVLPGTCTPAAIWAVRLPTMY